MERGGTITWYLDVNSLKYEAGMAKARQTSKETAKEVDKNLSSASKSISKNFDEASKSTRDLSNWTTILNKKLNTTNTVAKNVNKNFNNLDGVTNTLRRSFIKLSTGASVENAFGGLSDSSESASKNGTALSKILERLNANSITLNKSVATLDGSAKDLSTGFKNVRASVLTKNFDSAGKSARNATKHIKTFRRELAETASLVRNFEVANRGFNMTSIIVAVTVAAGAIIELAGALASLAGAFYTIPALITPVIALFATMRTATVGLGDAFSAIGDEDAEKLNEALKKLSPSARAFVRESKAIYESFKPIRSAVQEAFFESLDRQMRSVASVTLPTLRKGMVEVASSMNGLATTAANVIKEPFFQSFLADSFRNTATNVDILSGAVRPLAVAFTQLVAIGAPYTQMLSQWIVDQSNLAAAFLSTEEGQNRVKASIDGSIASLKLLGGLLSSVTGLLSEMFTQSAASGDSLIITLTNAFNAATAFLQTAEGSAKFQALLRVTNEVFRELLGILGLLLDVILTVVQAFDGLPQPVKDVVIQFLAWSTVLAVVLPYISALTGSFKTLFAGLKSISNGFGGLVAKMFPTTGLLGSIGSTLSTLAGPLLAIAGLFGGLAFALGGTSDNAKAFQDFFSQIPTMISNAASQIPGLLSQFSGIIGGIIDQIIAGLPMLLEVGGQIIMALFNAILVALPGLLTLAGQIVEGIANGIAVALPALARGIAQAVPMIIDTLRQNLPMLLNAGIELLQNILNGITTVLPVIIQSAISIVQTLIIGIGQAMPLLVNAAIQIILALINFITQNIGQIITLGIQLINTLLDAIITSLPLLIEAAIQIILALTMGLINNLDKIIAATFQLVGAIINALIQNAPMILAAMLKIIILLAAYFLGNIPRIISVVGRLVVGLGSALMKAVPLLVGNMGKILGSLVSRVISGIPGFLSAGGRLISGLISGIGRLAGSLGNAVRNVIVGGYNAVVNFVGRFLSAGGNIIRGIVNGIAGGAGAVINKVKEIASGALDAIKNFFGIRSPSRVMAQMGDYMMQGLQKGIEETGKAVSKTANDVSKSVAESFNAPIEQEYKAVMGGVINSTANLDTNVNDAAGASASIGGMAGITNQSSTSNSSVNIYQENIVNSELDMNQVNKNLTWELNKL